MNSQTNDATTWRFWIDVGGTFTDCFGISPSGSWSRCKVLSSSRLRCQLQRTSIPGEWRVKTSTKLATGVLLGFACDLLSPDGSTCAKASVAAHGSSESTGATETTIRLVFDSANPTWADTTPWTSLPSEITAEFSTNQLAPLLAIRLVLGIAKDEPLPPIELRLGTTRGTNALLTRSGARTAFVTTRGFRDALEIGDQQRPDLFALTVKKAAPLYETAVEIDERLSADGSVLQGLDPEQVRAVLERLKQAGIESLAVCLLHAYRNPCHELELRELAQPFGFRNVSLSHCCSPLIRLIPRASTTVLDAYLNPVLRDYVAEIESSLGSQATLLMMTSSGGLVPAAQFSGKDSVLSGPAGGVVGFSAVARSAGHHRAIGFDMGGTSTDVARLDGTVALQNETRKAGVVLQTPTLAIETVAAGGGSICWFDGQRLLVGPQSAGADPGPACYGRGGPLTITDMNVWLRRIRAELFPLPLQVSMVGQALEALAATIQQSTGRTYLPDELAAAYLQIANAHIAGAMAAVSIRQGMDPREYPIVAFGGAAAQQVCGVAQQLGIKEVLVHPDSALLSAYGIGHAELRRIAQKHLAWPVDDEHLQEMAKTVTPELHRQAMEQLPPTVRHQLQFSNRVWVHVAGTEQCLVLELPSSRSVAAAEIQQQFWNEFAQRFGVRWERPLQLATLEVEVVVPAEQGVGEQGVADRRAFDQNCEMLGSGPQVIDVPNSTIWLEPGWVAERNSRGLIRLRHVSAALARQTCSSDLAPQETGPRSSMSPITSQQDADSRGSLRDPSMVRGANHDPGTTQCRGSLCDPTKVRGANHYSGTSDCRGSLRDPSIVRGANHDDPTARDPVLLELFCQRLSEIATQMGLMLQATCSSVNVKERLDFSCAVFDRSGNLLVNAPHIPVHLGAMSETVKRIIGQCGPFVATDVFITNDPFQGGSHLPDVTVVTPVFVPTDANEIPQTATANVEPPAPGFWVASRAHHAEIGGITPGSMPPFATCLEQEGVVLRNLKWTTATGDIHPAILQTLRSAKYPSRSPDTNVQDIQAQVAANAVGRERLLQFVAEWGWPQVAAYAGHVQDSAAEHTLALIQRLPHGRFVHTDQLDCGLTIRLVVTVSERGLVFDFTGTDAARDNNFNCNPAIVQSTILYCLRVLIGAPIPLNQGVLRPIEVCLPKCFLNPLGDMSSESVHSLRDHELPAVGGGNVETSQRLVDVVFGALQAAAASQGTMNNFLFGDESFGFYETIGGGCGATEQGNGASAVHSHMTNTRLTDPEVLETRYPVRLLESRIRFESGGRGLHTGGDGIVRRFQFLRPMDVSLVTNRRSLESPAPYGLRGGEPGERGRNLWVKRGGETVTLSSSCQFKAEVGDIVEIQTPGGGGWGSANPDPSRPDSSRPDPAGQVD